MSDPRDEMPTVIVTDPDGYLVQVGSPEYSDKKELGQYAMKGYTIRTVKFKEYVAMDLKWIYDKPKEAV